ncbi:hypothetical protein BJ912DRAFT_863617 [Pholiota molesta]|nr:hypothetical protein BJ912DRAFT_863617 [Pholiota molesta]
MLTPDAYNPGRQQYSYDKLPIRQHQTYFKTLRELEAAGNENQRRKITKATGVSRLPLCAASPAFFHPTFFPLDPFHLIYENCMAFIWDLWTIESTEDEVMHISAEKGAVLGNLVAEAMGTLPPSFCGPVRNPHLKRQSQYKVFEWMALLHWYLVPIGLELKFNSLILENFSRFVQAMEYAMTSKPRTEQDLEKLYSLISQFLTDFERLYIGNNPDRNNRARLCIFQLIHIPLHMKWNGSIRIGSQATVERSIGEMGHKIRSKKSPFANLTNIIIRRERIKLLCLYYPDLSLNPSETLLQIPPDGQLFQKVNFTLSECQPGCIVSIQLSLILGLLRMDAPDHIPHHGLELDDFRRFGKLRLPNRRVLHSELAYSSLQKAPTRKSCWFSLPSIILIIQQLEQSVVGPGAPLFGLALAFYSVKIMETNQHFVIYKKLMDVEHILGFFRGKLWSTETYALKVDKISDIVGIWSHGAQTYILQKHPGLDMLNTEESGKDDGCEDE